MFLGSLLLLLFASSLPWVWVNVINLNGMAIRPSVFTALLVVLFYLWKGGPIFKGRYVKVMSLCLVTFIIWVTPCYYNEYPHWSSSKVFSFFVYAFLAYFSAQTYLLLRLNKRWKLLWTAIALILLLSTVVSFYMAFGSLLPNLSIKSSDEFIQSSLYANLFDPTQRGGKGIRHTMAIVPVVLMGLIVHNRNLTPKINIFIFGITLYLIFFTMSRAAWLAALLVILLMVKIVVRDFNKNFLRYFALGIFLVIMVSIFLFSYPQVFNWFAGIVGDRVSDNRSTGGRLNVLLEVFLDMELYEYVVGSNRVFQYSPHNMILDAFMQSGILGFIITSVLFVYVAKIYIRGLLKSGNDNIVPAALVTPAFVRMFSAGSGMLHIAELFSLIIAVNLLSHSKLKISK